jgi:hypothetical protein
VAVVTVANRVGPQQMAPNMYRGGRDRRRTEPCSTTQSASAMERGCIYVASGVTTYTSRGMLACMDAAHYTFIFVYAYAYVNMNLACDHT